MSPKPAAVSAVIGPIQATTSRSLQKCRTSSPIKVKKFETVEEDVNVRQSISQLVRSILILFARHVREERSGRRGRHRPGAPFPQFFGQDFACDQGAGIRNRIERTFFSENASRMASARYSAGTRSGATSQTPELRRFLARLRQARRLLSLEHPCRRPASFG